MLHNRMPILEPFVYATSKIPDAISSVVALLEMSRCPRKPDCIGKNKDTDQLCNNCTADQRLCFCFIDGKMPLLTKSIISSV